MAQKPLEKVLLASARQEDAERALAPPASSALLAKPSSTGRLLRVGAFVLPGGVVLLLFGVLGAAYSWKADGKETYNVHYPVSIDGKIQEGSMEVDTANNLQIFKTGSGREEAVEVHDFQLGIAGIHFAGGEKCFVKAEANIHIPEVSAMARESLSFDLKDEILPAKFGESSLVWVAANQPIKNYSFLCPKILELCHELQILWLRPSSPKVSQRKKKGITRKTRQTQPNIDPDQFEAAAEEVNTRPTPINGLMIKNQLEEGDGMSFDSQLDHEGICCTERTHCRQICEPLLGFPPWPYHFQGCHSACRLILPCSWWVARILGVV
ncbi:LOW QUALITY PROTEIN: leukocyte cell-derived chemotaxin 1 [Liasis olivaceus]